MTTKDRSRALSTSLVVAVAPLLVTACGVGSSAPSVESANSSSRLPAGCQDVSTTVHQQDCLDSVQQKMQSDVIAYAIGGPATHAAFLQAYSPLAIAWASELSSQHARVHVDSGLNPAADDTKATGPIQTTWSIADQSRVMWVCFQGKAASVQTTRCA